MNENNITLAQKEAALAQLEAMAAELRTQVEALRKATKPSAFELMLNARAKPEGDFPKRTKTEAVSYSVQVMQESAAIKRNSMGSVSNAIIEFLDEGSIRSVDMVYSYLCQKLEKPPSRGSVRGTLSHLVASNKIEKIGYGEYKSVTHKGESTSADNTDAFNFSQPPLTGQ